MATADEVLDVARRAKAAAAAFAPTPRAAKDAALLAMADALVENTAAILAANAEDLERGRAGGLQRLLDHVSRTADVWVTRRIDIARHWAATHPPA